MIIKSVFSFLIGSLILTGTPEQFKERANLPYSDDRFVSVDTVMGHCSGSVIGEGLVLTAAHCVDDLPKRFPVLITFENGKHGFFFPIYVGHPGTAEDIAILRGPTFGIHPLEIASHAPSWPDTLLYVSNRDFQRVIPAALDHPEVEAFGLVLILNAQCWPGDSGSALLNQKGEVLGVVFARNTMDPHLGYATSYEVIAKALKELEWIKTQNNVPSPGLSP